MGYELRLVSLGIPFSEAVGIVYQLKKEGTIEEFVRDLEKEYHKECEMVAQEAVG